MIEPSLAMQKAIVAALVAGGVPVFDRVPDVQAVPYIQVGDDQVVPDRADCFERSCEITSTIHAFSYGGKGRAGAKAIAQGIVEALENVSFDLGPDWSHLLTLHEGSRYLDEPDGRTVHAVLTFKTLLDAAS